MHLHLLTAAGLVVVGCASPALAQRSVPGAEFDIGGWQFIPTLYDSSVETIVALRENAPVGENITTLWFTRLAGGDWATWGFREQDQAKTLGCIKAALLLGDETDEGWPVVPAPVSPEDFPRARVVRGVFENDPFAATLASATDPDAILAFLESIGWRVARSDLFVGPCPELDWLDAIALGVEAELASAFAGMAAFQARLGPACQGTGGGGAGTCVRAVATGRETAWTCTQSSAWSFTGTVMQPMMGAGCCPRNSWTATAARQRPRTVSITCANCTVVNFKQSQIAYCTVLIAAEDMNTCVGTGIPCPPVPPGYTPPPSPPGGGVGTPCVVNPVCAAPGDWGPPFDHICP